MMPELLLTFPSPLVRSPVEEAPGDALSAMCRGMRRSRCHARGRGDSIALRGDPGRCVLGDISRYL